MCMCVGRVSKYILTSVCRFRLDKGRVEPILAQLTRVGVAGRVPTPRGRGLGVGIDGRG